MSDVAQLGLAVDSGQVTTATAALNSFSAAAGQATQATQQVGSASRTTSATISQQAALVESLLAKYAAQTKAANDNASAHGGLNAQAQAAMHAMRSFAEQVALGVSPLQAMTAQASRLSFIASGPQGLVGAFKGAISPLTNMLGIGVAAFGGIAVAALAAGGAALSFYQHLHENEQSAEQALEEHARLLKVVQEAYRSASIAAGQFYQQGQSQTLLQAKQNLEDLVRNIRTGIESALQGVGKTGTVDIMGNQTGFTELDLAPKIEPFRKAIEELNSNILTGSKAVKQFEKDVADIGNANPALQEQAAIILRQTQGLSDMAASADKAAAAIRLLQGTATLDDRRMLGLPDVNRLAQLVQFLGAAATPSEKLKAAMSELAIKAKDLGVSTQDLGRAESALKFDSMADQFNARINALGSTASVSELVRQKWIQLQQAQREGAGLTQDQINRQLQLAAAQASGLTNIQAMIDAEKIRAATLGMSTEKATAYAIAQAEINRQLAQGRSYKDINVDGIKAAANEAAKLKVSTDTYAQAISDAKQGAEVFSSTLIQGLLDGKKAMDALADAAKALGQMLIQSGLKALITGLSSGNFIQAAIGGGEVIGGALLEWFGGSSKSRKELEQAQQEWEKAGPTFQKFLADMSGTSQGSLADSLQQARQRANDLAEQARKANKPEVFKQLEEAYQQYAMRIVKGFMATFDAMTEGLESGLGPDSPLLQAAQRVSEALAQAQDFIGNTKTAWGDAAPQVEKAKKAEQDYLLSLLQTPKPLSEVQKGMLQIHGTATALFGALTQLGMSAEDAAKAINDGVTKAIQALADAFSDSLTRRLNIAGGKDYLNSAADLIKQHQQDLADAATLGNDPDLLKKINATYMAELQKLVDDAGLTGSAFEDFIKLFPEFAGAVHQATAEFTKSIQAIQQYIDSLKIGAGSILSPQDQLNLAQQKFQQQLTLASHGDAGALASITQYAQTYLEQAKSFYASSQGYADIFNTVMAALQALVGGTGLSTTTGGGGGGTVLTDGGTGGLTLTTTTSTATAANDNATLFQQQTSALSSVMMQGFNGVAAATSSSGAEIADLLRQILSAMKTSSTALRPDQRAAA